VASSVVKLLEDASAVQGDLKAADARAVAIRFGDGGLDSNPVLLEVASNRLEDRGTSFLGDVPLEEDLHVGQTAQDVARSADHAHPGGVGEAIDGPRVLVEPFRQELESRALADGVPVFDRNELAAGGEVRRMASNAEGRLLERVRGA